jgi:hypothetical protein
MTLAEEYIASLNPKEKQAYEIAKKHLGSLLTLEKTNHYIKWITAKKNNNTTG